MPAGHLQQGLEVEEAQGLRMSMNHKPLGQTSPPKLDLCVLGNSYGNSNSYILCSWLSMASDWAEISKTGSIITELAICIQFERRSNLVLISLRYFCQTILVSLKEV